MHPMTQKEFVEKYNKGERIFSGVMMQFFDISDMKFQDIKIRDSKLLFCTFRNCDFINAIVENCEIYWLSFYNGKIFNTVFEKCKIEMTLFDSIQFSKTRIHKSNMRVNGIFNSNAASVDISTSSPYCLLTDISQITSAIVEDVIKETMANTARLDVNIRMKLKEMLHADMKRYNLTNPEEDKKDSYSHTSEESSLTYGEVRQLVESAFGVYSQKNPYEMKTSYRKQGEYRKETKRSGPPF